MHVLLYDDLGRLTLRRLWPWHQVLARTRAPRLDRELANGTSPEASAILAARAMRLTSTAFRRDLAASLQRILAAAGKPPAIVRSQAVTAVPPRADGAAMPGRADADSPAGTRVRAEHRLPVAARPPRIPLRRGRVSQSASLLAALASRLVEPGPVPVSGVAMVSLLLADGMGPLYREACRDDLGAIIDRATQALTASARLARNSSTGPTPEAWHLAPARPSTWPPERPQPDLAAVRDRGCLPPAVLA